jgi:hypothetical protein
MTTDRKPTTIVDAGAGVITDPGAKESLVLLVSELPEADPEDAENRILEQLLAARNAAELNQPWQAEGLRELLDVPLVIESVRRAPSDYEDGIGVYVVITAVNQRSGRRIVTTTGSVNVIAQLIMAHSNGWLPVTAICRGPKRPPKNGRTPLHLEFQVVGPGGG